MGRKSRLKKLRQQDSMLIQTEQKATHKKKEEVPKKLKKYDIVAKVLTYTAIFLVAALVFLSGFAGFAYYFTSANEATVAGTPIKTEEVNKRLEAMKAQYREYGINPDDSQYASMFVGMRTQILDGMIENQLLYKYGVDNNLEVSKEDLDKKVEEEFENTKKNFETEEEFKKALKANNLTEETLKEKLSKELKISMTVDKVLEEKYKEVKVVREEVVNYFNEVYQVKAEHLLVKTDEVKDKKTEEALKKLATTLLNEINDQKGKSDFNFKDFSKAKEKEYEGKLKYEDLGFFGKGQMVKEFEDEAYSLKDGEISGKIVETEFGYHIIHRIAHNTRKVTFDTPEEREVQRILFSVASDASQEDQDKKKEVALLVLNQLKKGTSFEALAKEYSEDTASKDNGGSLGYVKKGQRGQVFDDFVFAAKVGDMVKEPLRTSDGFEILKVTGIKPMVEAKLSDEDTFKKVENELLQKKKDDAKKAFLEELKKVYPVKMGNLWKSISSFITGK